MTQNEILIRQDLIDFEIRLIKRIEQLMDKKTGSSPKKYLKSKMVRERLSISPGTLSNMRLNGTLNPKKIGGIFFYDADEINNLFS